MLGQFPVIGDQIKVHALTGHTLALVIGLVIALLGGLGVTQAAQNAFNRVWAVPFKDRPEFPQVAAAGTRAARRARVPVHDSRPRSPASSRASVGRWSRSRASRSRSRSTSGCISAAFRFLTAATIPTRSLWVGVAFAAVFLEILQLVGGIYINHVVAARERDLLAVRARDRAARVATPWSRS